MDLVWLVYAISLLQNIGNFFTTLVIISTCAIIAFMLYRGAECSINSWDNEKVAQQKGENGKWAMGHVKTALKVLIPCTLVLTFLPTEKTAYVMVGAYATQKVAQSGVVQETGGKVLTIINQKLDTYVQEGIEEAEALANAKAKKK